MLTGALAILCALLTLVLLVYRPAYWPVLAVLVVLWGIGMWVFRSRLRNWLARWVTGGSFENSKTQYSLESLSQPAAVLSGETVLWYNAEFRQRLLGGEESDLFARLRRGGEQCWYVPGAVMYHIIPPSKLTRGYFDRLCRNIGVSQRTRAAIDGGLLRLWTGEAAKWCATLGIALGYCLTGRVRRAAWLVRMRRQITAGLLTSAE